MPLHRVSVVVPTTALFAWNAFRSDENRSALQLRIVTRIFFENCFTVSGCALSSGLARHRVLDQSYDRRQNDTADTTASQLTNDTIKN